MILPGQIAYICILNIYIKLFTNSCKAKWVSTQNLNFSIKEPLFDLYFKRKRYIQKKINPPRNKDLEENQKGTTRWASSNADQINIIKDK